LISAAVVGFSLRALLHLRLFSVTAGGNNVPVGLETLVFLYEPWLLAEIELFSSNKLSAYIKPAAARYKLSDVRKKCKDNLPNFLTHAQKQGLGVDFNKAVTVEQCMRTFISVAGKGAFDATFP